MMVLIALLILLVPGLIATRIHWRGRTITRADSLFLVWDYLTYTFLILLLNYGFMFFTYAERKISFSSQMPFFDSNIFSASFVFKYSLLALLLALALPSAARHGKKLLGRKNHVH